VLFGDIMGFTCVSIRGERFLVGPRRRWRGKWMALKSAWRE